MSQIPPNPGPYLLVGTKWLKTPAPLTVPRPLMAKPSFQSLQPMQPLSSTKVINIAKSCPFKARRTAPPRADPLTESAIKGFQLDVERIISRARNDVQSNITPAERSSIRELASTKNVTITRSDKGGEIVIMPTSTLHKLNMEHLNDTSTYKKLAKDPMPGLRLTINKTLENILERGGFSKSIIYRLTTPPSACTQRFYTLPKTHKVNLKIRPIVSGRNGIFERLSWFLQIILKPLVCQVKAHVGNTEELLNRFHKCPSSALQGSIPVSFDVVSFYTNIDIEEAISTALQYGRKYNIHLYGFLSEI